MGEGFRGGGVKGFRSNEEADRKILNKQIDDVVVP